MHAVFVKVRYIVILLLLVVFFQNCGGSLGSNGDSQSADQNVLNLESICGKSGYEYLLKKYFRPKCAGCHGENGFVDPKFATNDFLRAYYEAKSITRETMIETITNNGFCGESCNLKESDATFQEIMAWVKSPDNCNQ